MSNEMIKQLLDACFLAKKITELMPGLPKGLKPRHIHIITCIAERGEAGESARVSDISADLRVTMPSITKLINELVALKIAIKSPLEDKRAIALSLTALGEEYYDTYVTRYHGRLLHELADMDMTQCAAAIVAIKRLYQGVDRISRCDFDENCD